MNFRTILLGILLLTFSCSLPPEKPVTIAEFERLKLSTFFTIKISNEEIIRQLNSRGEIVFEALSKKSVGGKQIPFLIQVWATPDGPTYNAHTKE